MTARDEDRDRRGRRAAVPRRATRRSSSSTCSPVASSTTSPRPSTTPRRARSCSTGRRSSRLGDRVLIGERTHGRGDRALCAVLLDLRVDAEPIARRTSRRRSPRTSCDRGCCPPCTSACAPGAASSSPSCGRRSPSSSASPGSTTTTTTTRSAKLDEFVRAAAAGVRGVRRQPAAADARRQGRLPLRRVRIAARARGRRGAGRRSRPGPARPREDDVRARDPGGHRPRAAPQRHVRARDAPDVRLPRRRREPRRAPDVGRTARADLRLGRGPRGRRRRVHLGAPAGHEGQGQGRARRGVVAQRLARAGVAAQDAVRAPARRAPAGARRRSTHGSPTRSSIAAASLGIAAEAGMGKSRLIAEFVRSTCAAGSVVAFGECQAYGANSSYFVWHEIWRRLLRVEDDDPEAAQRARLGGGARRDRPGARRPPAAARAGRRDRDPRHRPHSLVRCQAAQDVARGAPRATACAPARDEPVVIVIEDCHWIDELSRDLLEALVRAATGAAGAVRRRVPARRRARRRPAASAAPARDRPRPARRRRGRRGRALQARAGAGPRRGGDGRPRRA